jgi:hypothetical protein
MTWGIVGACAGLASVLLLAIGYVTKFAKMETKVNLLWTLYVEDRMKKLIAQGDMKRSSEAETTEKGEGVLPPSLKEKLTALALKAKPRTIYAAQLVLAKELNLDELNSNAQNPGYTAGELVLLAAGYMVKVTKSHSNSPQPP